MTTPLFPAGIALTRVAGWFLHPDGSPAAGSVTFRAPSVLRLSDADFITVGGVEVRLDSTGRFSVELLPNDTPGVEPSGWTYRVTERFSGVEARTYSVLLPTSATTVDLADIAPTSPLLGTYLPVVGPPGPPGPASVVNGKSGPSITLNASDVGAQPTPQTWSQAVARAQWTIPHTLPYLPEVSTFDTSGREIGGSVTYPDTATVVVVFAYAETGSAILR